MAFHKAESTVIVYIRLPIWRMKSGRIATVSYYFAGTQASALNCNLYGNKLQVFIGPTCTPVH